MTRSGSAYEIIDDEAHDRLVIRFDGAMADLIYHVASGRFFIDHTSVPPHLSGSGVGSQLVVAAIKKATAAGQSVVPRCSFAVWWIQEHPQEFAELTTIA